jgi:type I restriction enzyme, S subunit
MLKSIKFGDILEFKTKSKIKAGDGQVDGEYPFFTSSSIQSKFLDHHQFNNESLIFGTGGKASIHYYKGKFSVSTDCFVTELKNENFLIKYVYYYLLGNIDILEKGFKGAGLKHISKEYLKNIEIPILPIIEQKKIVSILDESINVVQKRKKTLVKLEELILSVFVEMFGNPVTNIKNFEKFQFGDICDLKLGKMLDKKKIKGNNLYPYLGNKNVRWGKFDLSDLNEMDFDAKDREVYELKKGDLLICEGGEIGRAAIWRWNNKEIYYQKALHRARVKESLVTPEYIQFTLWFFSKQNGFKDYQSSVTIAHLTVAKLKTLIIPLPPIKLQRKFSEIYNEINLQITKTEKSLQLLEDSYQSILHQAFTGKLQFSETKVKEYAVKC